MRNVREELAAMAQMDEHKTRLPLIRVLVCMVNKDARMDTNQGMAMVDALLGIEVSWNPARPLDQKTRSQYSLLLLPLAGWLNGCH